jgi:hypothetical protein
MYRLSFRNAVDANIIGDRVQMTFISVPQSGLDQSKFLLRNSQIN